MHFFAVTRFQVDDSGNLRRGRSAFTVIELLVSVAIIVLLLGILLTALESATDTAERNSCQSKLHTLVQASAMSALDHDGEAFLGFWGGYRGNHWLNISDGTRQIYGPWGYLMGEERVQSIESYICPSTTERHITELNQDCTQYNRNYWPLHYGLASSIGCNQAHTRSSYGQRPEMNLHVNPQHRAVPVPAGNVWGKTVDNTRRVDWNEYARLAVASDDISHQHRVERSHGDGVNVGYGDGSSKWIASDLFREDIVEMSISGDHNLMKEMFMTFDQAR